MKTFLDKRSQPERSAANHAGSGVSMPAVSPKIVQTKEAGEEELPLQGKLIVQKKGPEEEQLQMKAQPAQLQGMEEEEPLQKKPFQLKFDPIQKQGKDEDELLQKKPFQFKSDPIQKQPPDNEEKMLQGRFIPMQRKTNTTGLPDNLKTGVENLSGIDISDVKVHYNSTKPAQLQALAYAQGTDIHVAPGQERHLPHEAWHVVQQKQGRVQPTVQMKEEQVGNGVIQYRLNELTAQKILEIDTEEHCGELVNALKEYELIPEENTEELAAALDKVSYVYKATQDYIGDELVDNQNREDLNDFLDEIYRFYPELNGEVKIMVHNMPMGAIDENGFNEKGYFHSVITNIKENEPELSEDLEVETDLHKKLNWKVQYNVAKGIPFDGEPKMEDVKQGFLGDCWLMATLISLVNLPEGKQAIKDMIKPNNRESAIYTVTLYEKREKEYTSNKYDVLSRFPANKKGEFVFALKGFKVPSDGNTIPLWPAIIEKAFAKENESYKKIDVGHGSSSAFEKILGRDAGGENIDKKKIKDLVERKKPVTVATGTHYFAVLTTDDDNITLRNPHGETTEYTWDEFNKNFTIYNTDSNVGFW